MPTTACTSYYTTRITGWSVPQAAIVTFGTPTPEYSNITGGTIYQCNSVTLGGFNGLNN
jgi:hypothetical protein